MELEKQIQADMVAAMKAKETVRPCQIVAAPKKMKVNTEMNMAR